MTYLVKNILQLVLGQGTALDVLNRTEFFGHALSIFPAHGGHLLLGQLVPDTGIVSQIDLGADNEARDARAVVVDLREPLLADVLEGSGGGDTEANEEDIGLRVRERSQSVVIFLTGCIEKSEGVGLIANPFFISSLAVSGGFQRSE